MLSTKRSEKKDVWPGMYDVCTSGVQTAEDFIKWEDDDGQTQFDPRYKKRYSSSKRNLGFLACSCPHVLDLPWRLGKDCNQYGNLHTAINS